MENELQETQVVVEAKPVVKSIRYTPEQKQEVVAFVVNYNKEHKRGGQSKASEKFKISPITVGAWLDAAGVATKKNSKPANAADKAGRYPAELKQEVIAFVAKHNAEHGRGGQSTAAKKFGISQITVMSWLSKAKTLKAPAKADQAPAKKAAGTPATGVEAKLKSLLALSQEITKTQASLKNLEAKFKALKASL